MKTVTITRALGLGVTTALVTTAFPFLSASAGVPLGTSLVASSLDGDYFQPGDYTAGDITVQVTDGTGDIDVDDSQDLTFSWTVTPFAAPSTPVTVPATGVDTQATDVQGTFVVPLPAGQAPGTYVLTAGLGPDASSANAIPSDELLELTIGNAAPAGSTAVLSSLGAGTPGLAKAGTLTVTAPDDTYGTDADTDRDPVVGQVYSVTVDRGFFTTGEGALPSVVGARAGDLVQLGTTLTGVTDADGVVAFQVGIARDGGFDDDGLVNATVSVAGTPSATTGVAWDTSAPLNPSVAVTLSPQSEQDGPVDPALAGNRTFYEVSAFDQFGNRVGNAPVDLGYSGNLDDWDYSDDFMLSDFDSFGDIWITSFEAGRITITGTWEAAPTYRYVDTNGTTAAGTADAAGSTSSSTYEMSFGASRFSMTSSAADTVRIGTTVTQTVRVVDQQGNPVTGYQVRFLRYGPDDIRGDVAAERTTNALGEATYSFVGTRRGRAAITAEVSDGTRRRELSGSVAFGAAVTAKLARVKGKGKADRLSITTRAQAAGARVQLYKVVNGKQYLVASKKLDRAGAAAFKIRDRKSKVRTTYVAQVRSTSQSVADRSNTVKIR